MRILSILGIICALFVNSHLCTARSVTDTLRSATGDQVILSYDIQASEENIIVKFGHPKKFLGETNANKYGRKLEKLAVVFFDRTGRYDDITFSGDMPKAFLVPDNLEYSGSEDGYFFFYDSDVSPQLKFKAAGEARMNLKIPMFLAFQERSKHYKLISYLGDIQVKFGDDRRRVAQATQAVEKTVTRTRTVEIEADNGDMTKVLDCISNIERALPEQTALPLSESLVEDVKRLRDWQYGVTDSNLKSRVAETLDAFELKKKELVQADEKKKEEIERANQVKAAQEAKLQQEKEEARDKEQKQEAEKTKKKNIWMTIGGVFLAIVAFVANQVMQSLRSKKNQKSMMQMQQDISRRAEQEAKRRAGNAIRAQTKKIVNNSEAKVKDALKRPDGSIKKKGDKTSFSI